MDARDDVSALTPRLPIGDLPIRKSAGYVPSRKGKQPCLQVAAGGIEPVDTAPGGQEGIVDRFLGRLALGREPDDRAEDQRRVAIVELAERPLVSARMRRANARSSRAIGAAVGAPRAV